MFDFQEICFINTSNGDIYYDLTLNQSLFYCDANYVSSQKEHYQVNEILTYSSNDMKQQGMEYYLNPLYDYRTLVKEGIYQLSSVLGASALMAFLYTNPLAYGMELGGLFLSGLIADTVKSNSNIIANAIGMDELIIIKGADFISTVRWPLIGIASSITTGIMLEPIIHNEIILKTIGTALSIVFTHSFINLAPVINSGIDNILNIDQLEKHIHDICTSGSKRDIANDSMFFISQKFIEEELKLIGKGISFTKSDDVFVRIISNVMMSSIYRSLAAKVAHTIINEGGHPERHVEFPLEFITKNILNTPFPDHTYMNALLPVFIGSLVKKII